MRSWIHLLWGVAVVCSAQAQQSAPSPVTAVAFPFYNATQVLEGLYSHHLQPQAQHWHTQTQAVTLAVTQHCRGQTKLAEVRHQAWLNSLQAWQRVGTPAIGPVLQRRTQREIDFWPVRPTLLAKGLAKQPQTVADLRTIGTPAKGYPALEYLIEHTGDRLPKNECDYATLLAQTIEDEAHAVWQNTLASPPNRWAEQHDYTAAAFAEWVNQWLGGLERLRWAHIEKPLRVQQSSSDNAAKEVEFARLSPAANLADWRAQWESLYRQARLSSTQYQQPPQPAQSLIPIEALLMGKGHLALAQRWAQTLDQVEHHMAKLSTSSGPRDWLATSQAMQKVAALYQDEVAAALDVPLGFSDADGD